jgi:peptide-methionine (R)-S-oxide reductase
MTYKMKMRTVLTVFVGFAVFLWFLERWLSGTAEERRGVSMNGRVEKSEAEWEQLLTPEQYVVTRRKGTELAFSGIHWDSKKDGIFECICCGQPLFDSKTKYESGTGWPSFWQPVDENNVSLIADYGWLGRRTEVVCSRCDAHLGHVFSDGPAPTGKRFCMNSASLKLVERPAMANKE